MRSELDALIEDIRNETASILASEPEDVTDLYAGILPNGAGTGGQYFSTLVFAFADLRSISILYMGTGLLRTFDDETFTLEQCKKLITYGNLKVGISFLEYCGFKKLGGFSGRLLNMLDHTGTKEELRELVDAYFNYVWILYGWVIQKFPWGLGAGIYRKRTKEEFACLGERYLKYAVS